MSLRLHFHGFALRVVIAPDVFSHDRSLFERATCRKPCVIAVLLSWIIPRASSICFCTDGTGWGSEWTREGTSLCSFERCLVVDF